MDEDICAKWDRLTLVKPGDPNSMRGRMLADEELSEEEFERLAHRIALEAHEDRLKLWETALIRFERINALQARIDALMLEYCPDEMTAEQRGEYASCQAPSTNSGAEKPRPKCECGAEMTPMGGVGYVRTCACSPNSGDEKRG
jgi:hypothetical protein